MDYEQNLEQLDILQNISKALLRQKEYFLDLMQAALVRITPSESNKLPLDACVSYDSNLDARNQNYDIRTWQNIEAITFDVKKFAQENFFQTLQSLSDLFPYFYCNLHFYGASLDSEIFQIEGRIFCQWTFANSQTPKTSYSALIDITALISSFMVFSPTANSNICLYSRIFPYPDESDLNLFASTMDQMCTTYFKPQIEKFSLSQKISACFQAGKALKHLNHAYCDLFSWLLQMLLQDQSDNQQTKDLTSEAQKLQVQCDHLIEEISKREVSFESEEDIKQLKLLQFEDFQNLIKSHSILHFHLLNLRQKWNHHGIDKHSIQNIYEMYSSKPSFQNIHKRQDSKEIYFWIVLMAILLKELQFESPQLKQSPLLCWILQNPNMGEELKINLLNMKMRRRYYKTIKEAQDTLLRKFEDRFQEMNNLLKQTLELIEEDQIKPEVDNFRNQIERLRRPASHDLPEQELAPICKIRVLEKEILQKIKISREKTMLKEITAQKTKESCEEVAAGLQNIFNCILRDISIYSEFVSDVDPVRFLSRAYEKEQFAQ